ncbi:MAG TPA: hypothetical protein VK639_10800 [Terriglobales bacterium]|nr:hypothetical protein [Terriglobales bacterium]
MRINASEEKGSEKETVELVHLLFVASSMMKGGEEFNACEKKGEEKEITPL